MVGPIANYYGLCLDFSSTFNSTHPPTNGQTFTLKIEDELENTIYTNYGTISSNIISWTNSNAFNVDYPYITSYLN